MDTPEFPHENFFIIVAILAVIGALTLISLTFAGLIELIR